MFEQIKAMGAVSALLRDEQRMARVTRELKESAEAIRVIGQAGGGAVRVTADGTLRVLDVSIEPAALAGLSGTGEDRSMVQALVAEAVNDALVRARHEAGVMVSAKARELGLPDLTGALGKLLP